MGSPATAAEDWPPKDPSRHASIEDDEDHVLELPASPWTYENDGLNPHLQPHMRRRIASVTKRRKRSLSDGNAVSAVPPYHPDYGELVDEAEESDSPSSVTSSEDEALSHQPRSFIRRGSEGYEVQPIDREALFRQQVVSQITEPGR